MDYSGFSTINTQRFGQMFVGRVANPHDMILWHKAPARRQKVGCPLQPSTRHKTGKVAGAPACWRCKQHRKLHQ